MFWSALNTLSVGCSEPEVVVQGAWLVRGHLEADFSALAPLANALLLSFLALLLRQDVELGIQLLRLILVVVGAELVVVGVRVLPLVVRLDVKHLHEGADLYLAEVLSQTLVCSLTDEVAIA